MTYQMFHYILQDAVLAIGVGTLFYVVHHFLRGFRDD